LVQNRACPRLTIKIACALTNDEIEDLARQGGASSKPITTSWTLMGQKNGIERARSYIVSKLDQGNRNGRPRQRQAMER